MNLEDDKTYKMKMRDVEAAFKYRRIPYPKRSVEIIAIIAISCTFLLFLHTNKLNTRLKDMEIKLQPSELSGLGLIETGRGSDKAHDPNSLQGTYKRLKETGQIFELNPHDLNNTKKAEIDLVVFNRVPKTGSVQLIELMQRLGRLHEYDVYVNPQKGGVQPLLREEADQSDLVENIISYEEAFVYVSHVNYIDFPKFNGPKPIYINMVRDPVERVISWYYYVRAPWIFVPNRQRSNRDMPNPKWVNTEYDQCVKGHEPTCTYIEGAGLEGVGDHRRQTLFFCGHDEENCMPFNTRKPLELAKQNVDREYAVVGTWEDTNVTLTVLENYVPRYFRGAKKLYYSGMHSNIKNDNPFKPHISEEIKEIVRKNFTREIEFYQFCRQRLHKQYLALKLNELIKSDKSLMERGLITSG